MGYESPWPASSLATAKLDKAEKKEEPMYDIKIVARKNTGDFYNVRGRKLDPDGNIILAASISRSKLERFIFKLDERKNSRPPFDEKDPSTNPGSTNSVIWVSTWIEEQAARYVVAWILDQLDKEKIAPLPSPHYFLDAVDVHRAAKVFNVHRGIRGEKVRENLLWYVRNTALSYEEFKTLMEVLDWDGGLLKAAWLSIAAHGKEGVPEWDDIVGYCVAQGLVGRMANDGFDLSTLGLEKQTNGDW